MSSPLRARLRQRLILRYNELRRTLERTLGTADHASDALQETWLRLEHIPETHVIQNDDAYLLRMATHLAYDERKRDLALASATDIEQLDLWADSYYEPSRQAASKMEYEALMHLLEKMPPRRRAILLASRVEGLTYEQIAERFDVSVHLVHKEISASLRYFRQHQVIGTQDATA